MNPQNPATYFIKTDKGQFGPVTLEMVKTVSINRDTMLWKSGTDSWQRAEDFQELKSFFANQPPSSGNASLLQHSYVRKKILLLRLAKSAKPALVVSIILTIATAAFLWFRFQPNKFGQDEIDKINNYLNAQRTQLNLNQEVVNETPEEKKKREELWEFFLKDAEDPFKNQGIVPAAPATSIPYEYLEGFWDYCSGSNGKVYLNINNLKASFESRKTYLVSKVITISIIVLLATFLCIGSLMYYRNTAKNRTK